MSEKITDKRPQFFLVEDAVIEHYGLDPYSGWIYIILVKHADRKTGEAFPGIARLTALSNMSRAQVLRSITTLENKGLIRVERDPLPVPQKGERRERKPNHYFILAASNQPQAQGVVSDSNYPSIPQQLGVVAGVDHNKNQLTNNTAKRSISFPENVSRWTSKHLEAYYASNTDAVDRMLQAWFTLAGDMRPQWSNLTQGEQRVFAQLIRDLTAVGFAPDQYGGLCAFTITRWKSAPPKHMLVLASEYRASLAAENLKAVNGGRRGVRPEDSINYFLPPTEETEYTLEAE